jgi:hypothetical protein
VGGEGLVAVAAADGDEDVAFQRLQNETRTNRQT